MDEHSDETMRRSVAMRVCAPPLPDLLLAAGQRVPPIVTRIHATLALNHLGKSHDRQDALQ